MLDLVLTIAIATVVSIVIMFCISLEDKHDDNNSSRL